MGIVLVTGATGFVGANVIPLLHQDGHQLRCLVRPGRSTANLQGVPYELVEGSLNDEGLLREALRGVDMVVHMAALVSFRKPDTEQMWQVNARGTETLAREARRAGVGRFLHMSSVVAVGATTHPEILDERAEYNLGSYRIPYCCTKLLAEKAVLHEVGRGLDAVIVNPVSMFGPGDRRKTRGSLLDAAAKGRIPFSPPGGVNVADVRDVARGCIKALAHGRAGERYILGGQNLHGHELIEMVMRIAGQKPPRFTLNTTLVQMTAMAARVVEVFKALEPPITAQTLRMCPLFFWYSSAKAEDELGYSSRPVEGAIREAFRWMRELECKRPAAPVHDPGSAA